MHGCESAGETAKPCKAKVQGDRKALQGDRKALQGDRKALQGEGTGRPKEVHSSTAKPCKKRTVSIFIQAQTQKPDDP